MLTLQSLKRAPNSINSNLQFSNSTTTTTLFYSQSHNSTVKSKKNNYKSNIYKSHNKFKPINPTRPLKDLMKMIHTVE